MKSRRCGSRARTSCGEISSPRSSKPTTGLRRTTGRGRGSPDMPDSADSRSRSEVRREAPLWLSLDILHEAGDWSRLGDRDELIEAAGRALAVDPRFAARPPAEACVALSDDATVQGL